MKCVFQKSNSKNRKKKSNLEITSMKDKMIIVKIERLQFEIIRVQKRKATQKMILKYYVLILGLGIAIFNPNFFLHKNFVDIENFVI